MNSLTFGLFVHSAGGAERVNYFNNKYYTNNNNNTSVGNGIMKFFGNLLGIKDLGGNTRRDVNRHLLANFRTKDLVQMKDWFIHKDKIIPGPFIGAGTSGTVFKASYEGQPVAVKRILVQRGSELARLLTREAAILRRLNHPNIVRFYGMSL